MKRYNTPHRRRVIKTRLTEEEYAEFSERATLCKTHRTPPEPPKRHYTDRNTPAA